MAEKLSQERAYIVDLNMLNTYNEKGCEACNRKFNLGDTVVVAVGPWPDDCAKLIHEKEAVFDPKTRTYYEKVFFRSMKK